MEKETKQDIRISYIGKHPSHHKGFRKIEGINANGDYEFYVNRIKSEILIYVSEYDPSGPLIITRNGLEKLLDFVNTRQTTK